MAHAEKLADKIVAMGGEPVVNAATVKMTEPRLAMRLDDIVADESKHRDELRLMLTRWKF